MDGFLKCRKQITVGCCKAVLSGGEVNGTLISSSSSLAETLVVKVSYGSSADLTFCL